MKIVALALYASCIVGLMAAQQPKQDDLPKDAIVTGAGCVESGVEANCIVLKDKKTGELYNLYFEAGKAPKVGTGISFQGRTRGSATLCMQGKPVAVQKWTASDLLCSAPKPNLSVDTHKK